jgi:uncharacterized protein YndB with AHSA1/START domain
MMKVFETKREILASSKEIFKAFEDSSLLTKWWGPDGFTTTSNSFEFKPKGIWKFVMQGPDGKNYPNEMVFQEIVSQNKIVMRHSVEPYFTLTVTFEDIGNSAIVNWHQDFDSEEVARNIAHIVKPANEQNLDKLQAVVAST